MGDQFVDIVRIPVTANRRRDESRFFKPIDELRRDAVREFAEEQYKQGRFKTLDSSEKTLQDACTKRPTPDIASVNDFDRLLDEWLRGKIRAACAAVAATRLYRCALGIDQSSL